MERVGEHPSPRRPARGPLARATSCRRSAPAPTATAEVVLENAGTATWRSRGDARRQALLPLARRPRQPDRLGRPARRLRRPRRARRARSRSRCACARPQPPGRYRLAFDLVEELRFWFAEVGSPPLELDVDVLPRIDERRLAVVVRGGDDAGDHRGARGAGGAARRGRRRRDRAPRRRARSRRPTGRAGSSTRTPRGTSRSAARSRRASARCGPWAPGGGRNPAFVASAAAARRCSTGLEPGEHAGPARLRPGRRAGDLRRADQTSTATRSSTRLKTSAPSASETTVATTR